MNADLLIGYQQIPYTAISSAASAEDTAHPHENLSTGSRRTYYKRGSTGTSATVTWDLGSGNTSSINYAAFIRADLLTALGSDVDIAIHASTDNFSGSDDTIFSDTNITSADLIGPNLADYLFTGQISAKYRYWRAVFGSTSSYNYALSKIYLGRWFDFNEEGPTYPYSTNLKREFRDFTADNGTLFRTVSGRLQREFRFEWICTDDKRNEFVETVMKVSRHTPVLLYTPNPDFTNPLLDHVLVSAWIIDPQIESLGPRANNNRISATFLEDI